MRPIDFMERAVALAAQHHPHPNPRVGAVIVDRSGRIVGEGAHVRPGEAHAEQVALAMAGPAAQGSTVYVTLEPCAHHGRTPPCADALIAAGVNKVVAATADPDARVAGRGFSRLRDAGIDVDVGVGEEAVRRLDPGYFHHRRTGLPLVTVKAAVTLDGQMAAADGSSRWITDPDMRRDIAQLRTAADALMIGGGTVLVDDPSLDLPEDASREPLMVIVAGRREIPADTRLRRAGARVLVPTYDPSTDAGGAVDPTGDRVDLPGALQALASEGVLDVLVEGGPTLIGSLVSAGLVSRLVLYYGPKLAAGIGIPLFGGVFARIEDAVEVEVESLQPIGGGFRADIALLAG